MPLSSLVLSTHTKGIDKRGTGDLRSAGYPYFEVYQVVWTTDMHLRFPQGASLELNKVRIPLGVFRALTPKSKEVFGGTASLTL